VSNSSPAQIHFSQGRLHIPRDSYDRYLSGAGAVILLRREKDLLVLPVSNIASGGYILKIRNAVGDRVVNGAGFFRDNGLGDDGHWEGLSAWCQSYSGVRLYELFRM
jgi:hypothetical protein